MITCYSSLQRTFPEIGWFIVQCMEQKMVHMDCHVPHYNSVPLLGKECSSGTTFSLAMHSTAEITSKMWEVG